MGSSCNHIAAALFRMEAAMKLGLCNPACTTQPCKWLPNRTEVQPSKIKDMNLNRDDFSKRQKQTKWFIKEHQGYEVWTFIEKKSKKLLWVTLWIHGESCNLSKVIGKKLKFHRKLVKDCSFSPRIHPKLFVIFFLWSS